MTKRCSVNFTKKKSNNGFINKQLLIIIQCK
jgi:hypothetical protein